VTTDIAHMDTNAVAVLGGATDALARLGEWVQAARDAHALVSPLVDTAFVPEAYKPKLDPRATDAQKAEARAVAVANATAAVLQGITLGLDPLTSLQQIYIVHGRPGMYAKLMVALVQSRGHEVWVDDISDSRCVVGGRRKGSEHIERVTVTMDQARKAGWTTNQAYTKTPQDMLYARAAGRLCSHIASDVLMGIASVEEIQDSIQDTAEVANGHRTVALRKRATAPLHHQHGVLAIELADDAITADPPLEDEQQVRISAPERGAPGAVERPDAAVTDNLTGGADIKPEQPAGTITGAQQRMMHALLRDNGMADRDVALVWIAGLIDREIESTKELSKAEAGHVIDALNTTEAEPGLDEEA